MIEKRHVFVFGVEFGTDWEAIHVAAGSFSEAYAVLMDRFTARPFEIVTLRRETGCTRALVGQ